MENGAAYEVPLRVNRPRLFHDHRYTTALFVTMWGIVGILSTTGPGVNINPDHIMLCFLFLIAGVLHLLTVTAQDDQPMAERAAARVDGWIRILFNNEARRA